MGCSVPHRGDIPLVTRRRVGIDGSAPVFYRYVLVVGQERGRLCRAGISFLLLFQLHYFQRSFIFPFLLKGKSQMPVTIMMMGIVFNVLNGMMCRLAVCFTLLPKGCIPVVGLIC